MTAYAFSNAAAEASDHLGALAELYDPVTIERVRALIPDLRGRQCLEVGAGAGSIATWLADQVGDSGQVTAVDLDTRHIPAHPRLRTVACDITTTPVPAGQYDLIHARLLLNHLPERRQVVEALIGHLTPGGWLLTEDQSPRDPARVVACAPSDVDADLVRRFQSRLLDILSARGNDRGWAREAFGVYVAALVNVQEQVWAQHWPGGGPGCRLQRASLSQIADQLVARGMTPAELERLHELLADPRLVLHGHPLYSVAGQAPR